MEQKELRHDRHTATLLTDHMVITPKQPREIPERYLRNQEALIRENAIALALYLSAGFGDFKEDKGM